MNAWQKAGRPVPPPHSLKQNILKAYGSAFNIQTLVETGTFLGDMVHAMKHSYKRIISIELSKELHRQAEFRFQAVPGIEIINGDSGEVLPQILTKVSERCLFWLDGHYSAGETARGNLETPVLREIRTILEHHIDDHVILIDDARCFDGTHDYPTIQQVRSVISQNRPDYSFFVLHDVICIHPKREHPIQVQCLV
jgi:hypothetical protein